MIRRISVSLLTTALLSLTTSFAFAESPADAARTEARQRFDRGLQLFNEGDNPGALAEFKRAHELVPNKLVLFNIGIVYAAMNRPVEAVDALDRLLAEPGTLDSDRLGRAKFTREEQGHRVARLAVITNVPAVIEVDGIEAGRTPLVQPLRVGGGTHVVAAVAQGHLPARKEVTVAGETTLDLKLDLVPSESQAGHLTVRTSAPGVELLIDGESVGRTPLAASLSLAPGKHVVQARRPEYQSASKEITLGEGASGDLEFDLAESPAADAANLGRLVLNISETDAEITIDGRVRGIYRQSLRLPAGPHTLRVDRAGFEPLTRTVDVPAGAEAKVRVTLRPTPETRLAYADHVHTRKTLAWATLLAGVVVGGGGTALAVISQGKLDDARTRRAAVDATFESMQPCETSGAGDHDKCTAQQAAAYQEVSDQELRRMMGFVGVGVGVAAIALGTYLLLSGDPADKYDRTESELAWQPIGWTNATGGGFGIAGRF